MAVGTKIAVDEFERFVEQPENADRHFELIGGNIVEVVSNNYCSLIAGLILAKLVSFAYENGLGYITGADGGYRVSGEDYMPDVGFISKAKQPEAPRDTWNPKAPDLAVEVVSPSDSEQKIRIKLGNYLAAGTRVWVVYPETNEVEDYTPGQPVKVIGVDGALAGGDLLPGFALAVKDIFPE